jgi:hypothetical protein
MRNTLPALSIPLPAPSRHAQPASATVDTPQPIPTIRLMNATPSALGTSSDASTSAIYNTFDLPPTSLPLAPRPLTTSNASRKRLVPKKSKLGLLGAVKGNKERSQTDFSDVVRRIGGTASAGQGGYEIYVDHTEDPDLEEIVLVKRKKSRLGLDAVAWGPGEGNTGNALKPKASGNGLKPKSSTNILKPKSKDKENSVRAKPVEYLLKPKADENQKWWSIGRGRKDSKEQKEPHRGKCKLHFIFTPQMKPRVPDLDRSFQPQSRKRKPCVPGLAPSILGLCCPPPLLRLIRTRPIHLARIHRRPCWPHHSISNQNLALLPQLKEGLLHPLLVFLLYLWSERSLAPVRLLFAR